MPVRNILVAAFLFLSFAPANAVDAESQTWAYLKGLGNERVIFMSSCAYGTDMRYVAIFPGGETRGWLVQIVDGKENRYGVIDVTKASQFGYNLGGGMMTMRITEFLALHLLKSPFTLVKPEDFYLVFDGKTNNTCPEIPESVSVSEPDPRKQ